MLRQRLAIIREVAGTVGAIALLSSIIGGGIGAASVFVFGPFVRVGEPLAIHSFSQATGINSDLILAVDVDKNAPGLSHMDPAIVSAEGRFVWKLKRED